MVWLSWSTPPLVSDAQEIKLVDDYKTQQVNLELSIGTLFRCKVIHKVY